MKEARVIYGEHDVIAIFEWENFKALDATITTVRKLEAVIKTLTLIAN